MSVKFTLGLDRMFVPTWRACNLISSFKDVAVTLNKHLITFPLHCLTAYKYVKVHYKP